MARPVLLSKRHLTAARFRSAVRRASILSDSQGHGPFSHRGNSDARVTAAARLSLACRLRLVLLLGVPTWPHASFLSPEAEDTLARFIASSSSSSSRSSSSCCSGWCTSCRRRSRTSATIRSSRRSARCACCRWSSAACCGRWPGCGPTRSRSCYKLAYGTDKHPSTQGARRCRTPEATPRRRGPARAAGAPGGAALPAAELTALRADLDGARGQAPPDASEAG